jgi:tungstate transport system substrate-binding protein
MSQHSFGGKRLTGESIMIKRRTWMLGRVAAQAVPVLHALPRKALPEPLRVGVEQALVDGNLAARWQMAFINHTGLPIQLLPNQTGAVLGALERGEVDVSLTLTPERELLLERQGLAHHRMQVASGDWVLLGPALPRAIKGAAPLVTPGGSDIHLALQQIAQQALRFVGAPQGSAAHLAEQALWRGVQVTPTPLWYGPTPEHGDAIAAARLQQAFTLVERGHWLAKVAPGLVVRVQGDARLDFPVHVMQSFRVRHPVSKLFLQWIAGSQARRIAAATPGWQAAAT